MTSFTTNYGRPFVELRNVTKTYGSGQASVQAMRNVDIRVEKGDFLAIMGPSGSGKSTCLNILGCLDVPTAGEYLFQGINVGKLSRNQRAILRRYYLGFVFQGFNLLSRTSALDNVELPLIYRGVRSHERRLRARRALEAVGLKGWESHIPSQLSGGQQQRVAIARALITEPSLLMADEPTGNLDTTRGHEIMQLLTQLNQERGITVIMVTHEPDMAQYAKHTVYFRDGTIVEHHTNGGIK